MNFGLADKENITDAFANVRLFSPSRAGGGAKHHGGILERSSKTHAAAGLHCHPIAPLAVLSTPAHSHSMTSTSSSDLALAPKRAPLSKKPGLSERARRPNLFTFKEAAAAGAPPGATAAAQLCSAGISKSNRCIYLHLLHRATTIVTAYTSPHSLYSAITWNQRSRVLALAAKGDAPASASAFSSPKILKRSTACILKRSPACGAPHNSPLRGCALLDGSALMVVEDDVLCAGLALSGVAHHMRLPRVLRDTDGMFGEADAELASFMQGDFGCAGMEEEVTGGRGNPVALQLQLRDDDLPRMHAGTPQDAIYVQAKRL
jgi:hypothetical protein